MNDLKDEKRALRVEVTPRPLDLGGGFRLKCFLNESEEMGGVFDTLEEAEAEGEDWLQSQSTPSDSVP